ncbi:hypothetical protein [Glacieibacterium frigidum]|uniref:Uncharacterized protein n=1 Tax=Glacieibacterium frigidum TaxID=2593303 RepID=A0A552U9R6_9SPHN|nr:hypothetical protein [Glacieibacterium frigidum]TRW14950.1 hypothetical protein FMM06_14920 [Glacieibacterium frigidum]
MPRFLPALTIQITSDTRSDIRGPGAARRPAVGHGRRIGRTLPAVMIAAATLVAAPGSADPISAARNAQLTVPRELMAPTRADLARPLVLKTTKATVKAGILDCEQTLFRGRVLGEQCMTRNMPLIEQTDPRIDAALAPWAGVGCYDTSLLTIMLTQLNNRNAGIKPVGRTSMLMSIPAEGGAPKEVRQLNYYYKLVRASQLQDKLVAEGKLSQRTAYGLGPAELIADTGAGQVMEGLAGPNCNPYLPNSCATATNIFTGASFFQWADTVTDQTTFGNADIEKRLRNGQSLVLAFIRYKPVVTVQGGVKTVSFKLEGYHKVVPSGFGAGAYRLILNDVGYTGVKRQECGFGEGCVRFRVNMRRDLAAKLKELGIVADKYVWPAGVAQIIVDYEDDKSGNLNFLQHVDGLKLSPA